MRSYHHLFLGLLLCLGVSACGGDSNTSGATDSTTTEQGSTTAGTTETSNSNTATDSTPGQATESSAALRARYQTYLTKRANDYPLYCAQERGKYNPADEALADTAFFVFREELREVVDKRNLLSLLPYIDKDIGLGFGGEQGLQDFIKMWELDKPEKVAQSPLWDELAEILALGGTFSEYEDRRWFFAPYVDACSPPEADGYTHVAIIGAGVRMRAGTTTSSNILKNLSYDAVEYLEQTPIETTIGGETHPWIKVRHLDGTEGYVYGKFVRSPIDYRVVFEQIDESWILTSIVAGD